MTAVVSPLAVASSTTMENHHPTILQNTPNNTPNNRRPVPFPLPKKLGSDRLLLVSKALHEIPTYKSISPELTRQRKSLRSHQNRQLQTQRRRRVHFRAVDQVQEYELDYDESDYSNLWFRPWEVNVIFNRDDEDYRVCFGSMAHTKQILQLWGMCSRGTDSNSSTDAAVQALFQQAPHPRARGLEHRIITGIRNHRQKAVQAFLQEQHQGVCSRYLKFSSTAGRFAHALAQGDAQVALEIREENEAYDDDQEEEEVDQWEYIAS